MEIVGLNVPLWLVLLIGVLIIYYWYLTYTFGFFKNTVGVRGPKPWPLIGNMSEFFSIGVVDYDQRMIEKYGKLVSNWFGRSPSLIIADVEIIHEVVIKQFNSFCNRIPFTTEPPFDRMLTQLKDDEWRNVRHSVSPTFTTGKLRRMTESINQCAAILTSNIKKTADTNQPVDVTKSVRCFTMDVIGRTAFGLDIDSQSDPDNPFVKMAKKIMENGIAVVPMIIMMFFPFLTPYMGKLGISFAPKDAVSFFTNVLKKLVKDRKDNRDEADSRTDFLQLMLNAHRDDNDEEVDEAKPLAQGRKKLTENDILAQGFVFFLAGYDTVANSSIYVLYELACNPDAQEKLAAEIETCLQNNEKPSYDSVHKMKYLDMVVSEALRMYPAPRVDRVATRDITVNGVFLPKDTQIIIPINYLHHDPDIYPDPYKFDPERFSDEAKADRNPIYYQPFGLGPRNCVAMRLGLLEIKIVTVAILQRFTVSTCSDTNIPIKRDKLLGSARDVKLLFTERQ